MPLFLIILTWGTASVAQSRMVQFDPAMTKINFTLGDVLHTVHGTFRLKHGEIRFDPATGAASGALVVDAGSGDSGNSTRDRKMKREILQTDHYPDVVFSPTHVTGVLPARGDVTLIVQGVFRIHGADHDLTLSVPATVSDGNIAVRIRVFGALRRLGHEEPKHISTAGE